MDSNPSLDAFASRLESSVASRETEIPKIPQRSPFARAPIVRDGRPRRRFRLRGQARCQRHPTPGPAARAQRARA